MSEALVKRVQKEFKINADDNDLSSGIILQLRNDDFHTLQGFFPGATGTPYEGGLFQLDIVLTDEYPFKPPKMRFVTKVGPFLFSLPSPACSMVSTVRACSSQRIFSPWMRPNQQHRRGNHREHSIIYAIPGAPSLCIPADVLCCCQSLTQTTVVVPRVSKQSFSW